MLYDATQNTFSKGLGITQQRAEQLNSVIKLALHTLPPTFKGKQLHERVAPFIESAAEAYYVGSYVQRILDTTDDENTKIEINLN